MRSLLIKAGVVIAAGLVLLAAAQFLPLPSNNRMTEPTVATMPTNTKHQQIVVCLETESGSIVNMYADVEAIYVDGVLAELLINDTTVLSFAVSDEYDEGVALIDGYDFMQIVYKTQDLAYLSVDEEQKRLIDEILAILDKVFIATHAST